MILLKKFGLKGFIIQSRNKALTKKLNFFLGRLVDYHHHTTLQWAYEIYNQNQCKLLALACFVVIP